MESERINAVANEFLSIENHDISLLKLLKLCYFAQGFSLAILDRTIFDDDIEAWQYGPVVPSLYHEFKHFNSSKINTKSHFTYLNDLYDLVSKTPELQNDDDRKIIQIVWNMYGKYSANELVDITHKEGTPWYYTFEPRANRIIPIKLIKEYYKTLTQLMKKENGQIERFR
nr:MAG TPA: hypothetical protein [Caudoviricetes sp.]